MAYESLIENLELVQGDSSPIWFFGLPDNSDLDDGNWSARYVVSNKFGGTVFLDKPLLLNSGTGTGDTYAQGTKFIFQILPTDSATLIGGSKYKCTVEITNPAINFNNEIARFELSMLAGS
jgi:hypothetical protein